MPLPFIPLITGLISAFGDKKVKGLSQTVKEFATSKTNMFAGSPAITYGGYLLMQDPTNKIGHAYLIGGVALIAIKDAIVKIKTP